MAFQTAPNSVERLSPVSQPLSFPQMHGSHASLWITDQTEQCRSSSFGAVVFLQPLTLESRDS